LRESFLKGITNVRQDLEKWTSEGWAEVYRFTPKMDEGWASRKDISMGKV
jgi:hypothetical protein